MGNTKDRMDVVVEAIYIEDAEPANWAEKHNFDWKPNVALHFKKINKTYQPIGDLLKARTNGADGLWMFQAMGGKQAKGRFFDIMTESGVAGANRTPWTSFMPTAELFRNGQSQRITPPEKSQIPAPPPSAPSAPRPAVPAITRPATNGEKLPPIAAIFLDQALFQAQSNAWWEVKNAFNLDGAIISNSFQYAAMMVGADTGEPLKLEDAQDAILNWAAWFESNMRQIKSQRIRERFGVMLGICTTDKQVTEIVNLAWASLPKSHYDVIKEVARIRLADIKAGAGTPGAGTPNPEAPITDEEAAPKGAGDEEIPF